MSLSLDQYRNLIASTFSRKFIRLLCWSESKIYGYMERLSIRFLSMSLGLDSGLYRPVIVIFLLWDQSMLGFVPASIGGSACGRWNRSTAFELHVSWPRHLVIEGNTHFPIQLSKIPHILTELQVDILAILICVIRTRVVWSLAYCFTFYNAFTF